MKLFKFLIVTISLLYSRVCLADIANNTITGKVEYGWIEYALMFLAVALLASIAAIFFQGHKESKKNSTNKTVNKSVNRTHDYEINKRSNKKNSENNLSDKNKQLEDEIKKLQDENEDLRKTNQLLENYRKKTATQPVVPEESRANDGREETNKLKTTNNIYLTVLEGPLVEAAPEHAVYYKAWKNKGNIYFEFVNNDRTKKAINNRTSIIDPFCDKVESSKSPDNSEMVSTITPGLLNDDYSVLEKAKIEYK